MPPDPPERPDQDETTRTPPPSGDDSAGPVRRVGPYRLKRLIGAGGMGVVYEASHERLGRPVAIKFIGHAADDPEMRRRFAQERDTLAALRHPAIAHIYDAGEAEHDGAVVPYIAMEYIVGARPISTACREAGLGLGPLIELFESLFDALDHAHRRGILHRDLKPGNILMDSEGKAKIIDFGLSLPTGARGAFDSLDAEGGSPVGTYKYMSPEQRAGDPLALDHRTDIYSLALVMLEILEDLHPQIPPSVAAVLDGALKPEPAQRTPSAATVRDRLRACRDELVVSETVITTVPRSKAGGVTPFQVSATAFIIAAAVAYFAALPVLCGVLPVCDAYITFIERIAAGRDRPYRHVAVVMIDDTAIANPAFGAIDGPITLPQLRPFFDDLIDQVVAAGADAIVIDLFLPRRPGSDMTPLVESFRAARAAGVPVIQMDRAWPDGTEYSRVDPVFFGESTVIVSGAAICGAESWRAILAARPRDKKLLPGLGLAAFALRDLPNGLVELEGNIENEMLTVRCSRVRENGSTIDAGEPFDVPVTAWSRAGNLAWQAGLKEDDQTVALTLGLPEDRLLDAATISFTEAIETDPATLNGRLGGKIVIIAADCEGSRELTPYPGGRTVAKGYAHVETIESLFERAAVRQISDQANAFFAVITAFVGVGIGVIGSLKLWQRAACAVASAGAIVLAGVAFGAFGVIILAPVIAVGLLIGTGFAILLIAITQNPG